MQYTLRNVPEQVDRALRERARAEHTSLNEVVIEVLQRGLGLEPERIKQRDLTDIAGSWRRDPDTDQALDEQRQIDPALWR